MKGDEEVFCLGIRVSFFSWGACTVLQNHLNFMDTFCRKPLRLVHDNLKIDLKCGLVGQSLYEDCELLSLLRLLVLGRKRRSVE